MRSSFKQKLHTLFGAASRKGRAIRADQRGTSAIEFALVAGPFFFLLFGIISVGYYFFVVFTLEHAVEAASRSIRTGQAQTQTPNPMTISQFKGLICAKLPSFMDCDPSGATDKIRVNVQNFAGYGSITTPTCTNGAGNLIPPANQTYSMGSSNAVVLVSICYEWELGNSFANIPYWISPTSSRMTNGSTMVKAATAFTSEPYN